MGLKTEEGVDWERRDRLSEGTHEGEREEGRCENVTVLLSFVKLTQAASFWKEETKVRNCLHQLIWW